MFMLQQFSIAISQSPLAVFGLPDDFTEFALNWYLLGDLPFRLYNITDPTEQTMMMTMSKTINATKPHTSLSDLSLSPKGSNPSTLDVEFSFSGLITHLAKQKGIYMNKRN